MRAWDVGKDELLCRKRRRELSSGARQAAVAAADVEGLDKGPARAPTAAAEGAHALLLVATARRAFCLNMKSPN
jgi:hypothetical protein